MKKFKLQADEISMLAANRGSCIASDMITVQGHPVRFMYRESPDSDSDSGWRFLSGYEDEEYMDDPNNFELFDVNTICNYDTAIIQYLDAEIGLAFERSSEADNFIVVDD